MKKLTPMLIALVVVTMACHETEICNTKATIEVKNVAGRFYHDARFDRYVLHHHVPGTIDSFDVYIFCDASSITDASKFENEQLSLTGTAGVLDEDLSPTQVIAGEEFFVVASIEILQPLADNN
jgi:hypothetical protein